MKNRTRKTIWLLLILSVIGAAGFFGLREIGQASTPATEEHDHTDHEIAKDRETHADHERYAEPENETGHKTDPDVESDTDHESHVEHETHTEQDVHQDERAEAHAEDAHEAEEAIHLTEEERQAIGIATAVASSGMIERELVLPAEVRLNEDHLAHVVPRAPGIVREVRKRVGDHVEAGEVIAILESRELADAQAEYLAASTRLDLAQKELEREKSLWEQEISPERDYLAARRELEEARILVRAAEQKLRALGFSEQRLQRVHAGAEDLTRYEMNAPFAGEVIEKHIVLGEALESQSVAFIIADLNTVWVDVQVYEKDLPRISEGQTVRLTGPAGLPPATGAIDYIAPVVDTETRTALARIVLPNETGQWRPGLFLEVSLALEEVDAPVVIPKAAVQRLGEESVVFLVAGDAFVPAPVELGRESGGRVVISAGLEPGQRYVTDGAFELKAKLVTSGLGAHAGHGH